MDKQKYTRVMEAIRGRKEHIAWIMDSAGSMGKVSTFMAESICLQLRIMIEDIAVAGVMSDQRVERLAHLLERNVGGDIPGAGRESIAGRR